jgi:hypothetical protein
MYTILYIGMKKKKQGGRKIEEKENGVFIVVFISV